MKELVELLVRALVDHPDRVQVREVAGDKSVTYEVSVAPEDLGKVIGKQGRIANALRTTLKAAASKADRKAYLEIIS